MRTGSLATERFAARPEPKGTFDYPSVLIGCYEPDHVTLVSLDTHQAREVIKMIQSAIHAAEHEATKE